MKKLAALLTSTAMAAPAGGAETETVGCIAPPEVYQVAPALAEYTNRVLFGNVWPRPQPSARDRSLVTMASLIATGQSEQLPFHANRAMDNGLTRTEAAEVTTHLAYYCGWPRAVSAVSVLKEVLASRDSASAQAKPEATTSEPRGLTVQRHHPGEAVVGPATQFTGAVKIESLFQAEPPASVGGGLVHFEAGARTAWHTHLRGQSLVITAGCGWVQSESQAVKAVQAGDVVWIPPGARHWHGASADQAMSHFAVAESVDGSAVVWMEPVSDEGLLELSDVEAPPKA
jgi:4-carboxymuconolactone decarboxylase